MAEREQAPSLAFPPAAAAGAAYGMAMAAAITTFFGFAWLGWGLAYASASSPTVWIGVYVIALALGVTSVRAVLRGRALINASENQGPSFWSRVRGRFFAAVAAEIAGCLIVVWVCHATGRVDLIAAGIGIVVGLHFLPLGALFRFSGYYVTGSVMVAVGLASMALFRGDPATFFTGLVNGATLWSTAMVALRQAREFARAATDGKG